MEDSEHSEETTGESGSTTAWRKRLVIGLCVVVAISVAARVSMAGDDAQAGSGGGSGGSALVSNNLVAGDGPQGTGSGEQAREAEPSTMGRLLPFVTEGGVAMLLGIALGVATRAVFKIALILIAVLFVAVQFLAYKGVITIDWEAMGRGYESLKDYVFNVSSEHGIGQIVTHKLPSAGALGIGYMLGLKKG